MSEKNRLENIPISRDLQENIQMIKEALGDSMDVTISACKISIKEGKDLEASLISIDGLVDEAVIRESILRPLHSIMLEELPDQQLDLLREHIHVKGITRTDRFDEALIEVLKARILLLVDEYTKGLLIEAEDYNVRAIEEPSNELTVRGSGEGFIESLAVNMTMIRRRVIHPNLRFIDFELGELTKTSVVVCYLEGIADPKIVNLIHQRLNSIHIDSINNDGDIEELIEDHPYSIFPTVGNTERPDKAANLLIEGRVVVLINGSPFALYGPMLFLENFSNIEDYISRPYYSSLLRLIRFLAFLLCIYGPALYLTALNFEQNLIPSDLVVPIMQARELVPFPLLIELLIAVVMFEIVREAGVRLPKQIGSALSIVGALILGEVAVTAGLIGSPTIVVISISYIASFIITPVVDVAALLRILFLIASSLFGSYGIVMLSLALINHMVSLTSFGVWYMAPFSPFYYKDWKDLFIRLPIRLLKFRPQSIPNRKPVLMRTVSDPGDEK